MALSKSKCAGNFRSRILDADTITINDLYNPWNFFHLMTQGDLFLVEWCIKHGLLLSKMPCHRPGCSGELRLAKRVGNISGATLRCSKHRDHEQSIRKNSFFERSHLTLQDIFLFTKLYLDRNSLRQCATFTGIAYGSTAVDWSSFIRELMMEYYHRNLKKILTGEIEIDESLFGRKIKYHKGDPSKGLRVWVFGMVERSTNTIILYPVHDRKAQTLLPLIQRHCKEGSTIFSDGWSAYCPLNELGYNHFTVLHKYTFKTDYKNITTGEIISVNTNRIEGAWKHAKDYFRRMSGTVASQWESHMAEVMWRSVAKSNVYSFFEFIKTVYPLDRAPQYTYTTPLFDSWSGPFQKDDLLQPALSDNTETESESETEPENRQDIQLPETESYPSEDEAETTLVEMPVPVLPVPSCSHEPTTRKCHKTDNVCHPTGYMKITKDVDNHEKDGKKKKKSSIFIKPASLEWSDDDDFCTTPKKPPKSKNVERVSSELEEGTQISNKKRRRKETVNSEDQDEPVVKKKKRHRESASSSVEPIVTDNAKIRVTTKETPNASVNLEGDKTASNEKDTNQDDTNVNVESDKDLDDTASEVSGSVKKRKRIRKHRKKKKDQQNENEAIEVNNQTVNHNKPHTSTYKGREIKKDESFFGSYPDKLISPKFYRHGYRNLNVYQPEPNKHKTFNSDEDENIKVNTEQYNFMSSTKVLAEKEAYRKALEPEASDTDSSESDKESKSLKNGTYTEHANEMPYTSTKQTPVKDKDKGHFPNVHSTTTSVSSPEVNISDKSVYKDNSVKHNGYQSDTVTTNNYTDFQFKCPSSEPRPVRKASNPSPSQLTRKTLSSGASVFVRQRPGRGQQQRNGHFEMSKEDQLNTVASNVSTIFVNPESKNNAVHSQDIHTEKHFEKTPIVDEHSKTTNGEATLPSSTLDFSELPPLKGEPKKGDKIVYKVLEISATCTPEISDYREAIVLGVDKNQMVELKNISLTVTKKNRFHVEIEDEHEVLTNTSNMQELVQLHLSSLLDTRLVQSS